MDEVGVSRLLRSRRGNAVLAWALVGLVLITSLASVATGNLLWTAFTVVVAAIALLPPLQLRSVWVMPPWEIVFLATAPVLAHLFAIELLTGQAGNTGRYVSVAALALLVAVDLDGFTAVEMNEGFGALFVVVTTLATAGVWAVVRWTADGLFATGFLASEHALMLEFVGSATVGTVAGLVYVFYLRRRIRPGERVPEEVDLS
ncbi:hypothetical protein [Halorientalis pallida]|uniref:Uncharacterized protein n=1 Tax=Halorientalis pallida TaxID=2479928 RepID=A0A498KYI4_9EURY|nr:hypothetical protein [Halorientalis pallida]RXK51129.1 hypothetical protein EAF64_00315 [Halorientalis pallida]